MAPPLKTEGYFQLAASFGVITPIFNNIGSLLCDKRSLESCNFQKLNEQEFYALIKKTPWNTIYLRSLKRNLINIMVFIYLYVLCDCNGLWVDSKLSVWLSEHKKRFNILDMSRPLNNNRTLKVREFTSLVGVSSEREQNIVHSNLNMKKLFARRVS